MKKHTVPSNRFLQVIIIMGYPAFVLSGYFESILEMQP